MHDSVLKEYGNWFNKLCVFCLIAAVQQLLLIIINCLVHISIYLHIVKHQDMII